MRLASNYLEIKENYSKIHEEIKICFNETIKCIYFYSAVFQKYVYFDNSFIIIERFLFHFQKNKKI